MIKYTTTTGAEITLSPIPLSNREGFKACRQVLQAIAVFEGKEDNSDAWHDARFDFHDKFLSMCDAVGIDRSSVGEGDLVAVLSVLQTGELPGKAEAAK